jgi:hypothetical protein
MAVNPTRLGCVLPLLAEIRTARRTSVSQAKRRDPAGPNELISSVIDAVARNYVGHVIRKQRQRAGGILNGLRSVKARLIIQHVAKLSQYGRIVEVAVMPRVRLRPFEGFHSTPHRTSLRSPEKRQNRLPW